MSHLFQHLQELLSEGRDPGDHSADIYGQFGRTVAVMVIDSVGFSRTARQEGILHFLSRMIRVREVIKPALEAHDAVDIRFEADNVYAVFPDANAALLAAERAHSVIDSAGIMLTETEPYRVCIGIGYGELLHAGDEGYFGDQMNLASKLGEDIADGSETLITFEAHAAANDALLKGFADAVDDIAGIELRYARKRNR